MGRRIEVLVRQDLQEHFFHRHRKEMPSARDAWARLVPVGAALQVTLFQGAQVEKRRFPKRFEAFDNLWRLELAHAFRSLYTVVGRQGEDIVVSIEWIGDHKEYDELFGYSTS